MTKIYDAFTFHTNPWGLTTREAYVLFLLENKVPKQIESICDITRSTLLSHIRHSKDKMKARTTVQAAVWFDRWWQKILRESPSFIVEALERQMQESAQPQKKYNHLGGKKMQEVEVAA